MTQRERDQEAVRRAKAGSFEAFEELVARYERRVYGLALRMLSHPQDAEEVVQDSFLSAMEHLASFREEAGFYTWLMRIATNKALKLLSRRNRTGLSIDPILDEDRFETIALPEFIAQWKTSPLELSEREETMRILETALQELDEKYRLVFLLRDVHDLSTEDTAQALGISVSNVKVRLLRARLLLRERLTRVFGDPDTRIVRDHEHPSRPGPGEKMMKV